jgi:hypothetical protein
MLNFLLGVEQDRMLFVRLCFKIGLEPFEVLWADLVENHVVHSRAPEDRRERRELSAIGALIGYPIMPVQ